MRSILCALALAAAAAPSRADCSNEGLVCSDSPSLPASRPLTPASDDGRQSRSQPPKIKKPRGRRRAGASSGVRGTSIGRGQRARTAPAKGAPASAPPKTAGAGAAAPRADAPSPFAAR